MRNKRMVSWFSGLRPPELRWLESCEDGRYFRGKKVLPFHQLQAAERENDGSSERDFKLVHPP